MRVNILILFLILDAAVFINYDVNYQFLDILFQVEEGPPLFFKDFILILLCFIHYSILFSWYFWGEGPIYFWFAECFYHDKVLGVSNAFYLGDHGGGFWFLGFFYVVCYINLFLDVKPSLYSWDKSHMVMVYTAS